VSAGARERARARARGQRARPPSLLSHEPRADKVPQHVEHGGRKEARRAALAQHLLERRAHGGRGARDEADEVLGGDGGVDGRGRAWRGSGARSGGRGRARLTRRRRRARAARRARLARGGGRLVVVVVRAARAAVVVLVVVGRGLALVLLLLARAARRGRLLGARARGAARGRGRGCCGGGGGRLVRARVRVRLRARLRRGRRGRLLAEGARVVVGGRVGELLVEEVERVEGLYDLCAHGALAPDEREHLREARLGARDAEGAREREEADRLEHVRPRL